MRFFSLVGTTGLRSVIMAKKFGLQLEMKLFTLLRKRVAPDRIELHFK